MSAQVARAAGCEAIRKKNSRRRRPLVAMVVRGGWGVAWQREEGGVAGEGWGT